jgi:hypothetical protein
MERPSLNFSQERFPEALEGLLRERQNPGTFGRVNLRLFFSEIDGWGYEYLRKMVMGERRLQPEAIKDMAKALGVPPEHFLEYRLWQITELLRSKPELVDRVYEQVIGTEGYPLRSDL